MRSRLSALCAALSATALLGGCSASEPRVAAPLPALAAEAQRLTASGVSAGGYMAGQLLVAHSGRFAGAGLIAAGPYDCALGSLQRALGPCVSGKDLDVTTLRDAARTAAGARRIDPLENLRSARVWLFHGAADDKVGAPVVSAARDFFASWLPQDGVVLVGNIPATHGLPTLASGAACGTFESPYLNACDYDAAGELLRHLYGDLQPPATSTADPIAFDQRPFSEDLHATGYVFVPPACRERGGCRIHIVLHGCQQSAEKIGVALVQNAGYNRWAATNNLIVLYPQARASTVPLNPLGCWDWWGYSGNDYALRDAPQMRAILQMVDTMAGTAAAPTR